MRRLNDNVKVDMVTADQMSESDRNNIFNKEASVDAIPDLDVLTGKVYEILNYLEKPGTSKLMKTNESAVKMYLNNTYSDVPLGFITLLLEEESRYDNVQLMLNMFESLKLAKQGRISLDDAERKVTNEVNSKYVYSKYGGSKEAFEKQLAIEVEKEKRSHTSQNIEGLRKIGKPTIKK